MTWRDYLFDAVVISICLAAAVAAYLLIRSGHWPWAIPLILVVVAYIGLNVWGWFVGRQMQRMIGKGGPLSAERHAERMREIFGEQE